jgi:multiple sugar transport system substrate-binding protein
MKYLFAVALIGLAMASFLTFFNLSEKAETPVLYWVTQYSEPRVKQTELFERWMVENNYPSVDLRIDVHGKNQKEKNVIQGVSGVAADILDCGFGDVDLYRSVGMLEDVTEVAVEMGFDRSKTYPSVQSLFTVDDKQYGFPRLISAGFYWVNVEAFQKAGLNIPSDDWSFSEFERVGKLFVKTHGVSGERQQVFLTGQFTIPHRILMLRSMGVDIFNETQTAPELCHSAYQEVCEIVKRWTYEDKIIPSTVEAESLSAQTRADTQVSQQLFANGNFGLLWAGRWGLMSFRIIGPGKLAVCEFPNEGFRNSLVGAAPVAIYKKSKNKELAYYFLKFLASEAFNMNTVRNADGLPPIPRYAQMSEFSHPKQYPNEWGLHDKIRDMTTSLGIPFASRPFALTQVFIRHDKNAFDKFMAGRMTLESALKEASEAIENHITYNVSQSKELKEKYDRLVKDQIEIERLRTAGEKVPLKLITNPFYRRYYVEKGWSLPEGSEVASKKAAGMLRQK